MSVESSFTFGFEPERGVTWERTVAGAEDPEFMAVEMHRVGGFVKVADDEIYCFGFSVLDYEVVC